MQRGVHLQANAPLYGSPVTCVLSAILGNRTVSQRIADAVARCVPSSRTIWFDDNVYRRYPAPQWLRRLSTFEGEHVARRWLKEQELGAAIVVNGSELALAARHPRMAVALDTTPALLMRFKRPARSLMTDPLRWAYHLRFRAVTPTVRAWLPVSATVEKSLIRDYGVDPQRCFVTHCPQPVLDAVPHDPRGRLLFVGNDFARKGGELLLASMPHLPECHLTIVSNDTALRGLERERVTLVQGITDPSRLAEIYRASDLLVLPTRYDTYSMVICEAAAYAVPAAASRVGSVGELLDESGGASIPEGCTAPQLAGLIREVLRDGYPLRALTAARFATERLSLARFDQTMSNVLRALEV
jgi:glycosyltransferase involved in cell wall biosynthesis